VPRERLTRDASDNCAAMGTAPHLGDVGVVAAVHHKETPMPLVYVKPADSAVEHMLVEVGMASAHLSKTIGPMHCSHTANELHVCFVMA